MKRQWVHTIAGALAIVFAGSVLAGCGSGFSGASSGATSIASTDAEETQAATQEENILKDSSAQALSSKYIEGGKVTLATSTDCSNVAAWRIRSPYERLSWSGVYEPLFRIGDDGHITPNLAESLDSDYDNLTYTVNLRNDVYFSDGSKLDADVLLWNFENFKENSQSSATHFGKVDSFEKVDDDSVTIHLSEWTSQMPYSLADVAGLMYSKKAFDEHGKEWCEQNPVGTGPYVLDKWVKDEYKTFIKNTGYWNKDALPHLDSYTIRVIADQTAAENALDSGEIDGYYNGNTMFESTMLGKGYQEYSNTARYQGDFLVFASGIEGSPMENADVRKAICYAIDAQAICDSLGYGIDTFSGQYAAKGSRFFVDGVNDYAYDPEKAKQLLSDAGYPDGFKTTIYTGSELHLDDYMVVLQGYLKAVGIDADLQYADNAEWSGTIMYDIPEGMALFGHGFDNNIINQAYSNFALQNEGNGMLNKCKLVPDDLKDALNSAMAAEDNEMMMSAWDDATKLLFNDYCLAYTISHTKGSRIICSDRVVDNGWIANPCNYLDYTKIAVAQ